MILQRRLRRKIRVALRHKIAPRIQYRIRSLRGQKVVYAYYYNKVVNFGDLLTPELLSHYSLRTIWSTPGDARIVAVGSILHNLPEDYSGYIVGAGLIEDVSRRFDAARILALRGSLTRERIGAPETTVLGDPGLLADRLIDTRQAKRYCLGIVPHYVDKENRDLAEIAERYYSKVLVIDVQREPRAVIADIDKCEYILSSSLHGLVVSDSLDIPNGWIVLSQKLKGGVFKFYDYASAIERELEPRYIERTNSLEELIALTQEVSTGVRETKAQLDTVFKTLPYRLH